MLMKREDMAAVAVDYQERLMPVMYEKEELLAHSVILLTKRTWNSDLYHAAVYKRTWNDSAGDYRSGRNR